MPASASDPRVIGGRYYSAYWKQEYTVTAMHDGWFTVSWHPGGLPGTTGQTRHCTPWDMADAIISTP